MNKRNTLLYKNISLILFLKRGPLFVVSWEKDGETYTLREDFFPYLLPGARECQRLLPLASLSETPLIGCVSHARLPGQTSTESFSKSSKFSAHLIWAWRHPHSNPISCLGFIMTIVIVISFVRECILYPMLCTWTLNPNNSKPNQTEW